MRSAGLGIAHQLAIAMVGGHKERAPRPCDRRCQAAQSGVDRLHGGDGSGKTAGVSDHVGIGVVEHDQVELAGTDRLYRPVGQFGCRHLRLEIVGRDLRRRHHDALFARVGPLLAAVEEIGDVRIFFGLSHAQLRPSGARHHFAQHVRQRLGREDCQKQTLELRTVFGHAGRAREPDRARPREAG